MGFFDGIRVPEHEPPVRVRPPEWSEPPHGVVPGISTQHAVLVLEDDLALAVHSFRAYPTGVSFELALWARGAMPEPGAPWDLRRGPKHGGAQGDDILRFGIEFPDGARWTNLELPPAFRGHQPVPPYVGSIGTSGRDGEWRSRYWIWPLPGDGPLAFVADWPARGIAESRATIDGSELRRRASEAVALLPERP